MAKGGDVCATRRFKPKSRCRRLKPCLMTVFSGTSKLVPFLQERPAAGWPFVIRNFLFYILQSLITTP
jgi:hypothetical protein